MNIPITATRDHLLKTIEPRVLGVQGDHLTDVLQISLSRCGFEFVTARLHFTLPNKEPVCTEDLPVSEEQSLEYAVPSSLLEEAGEVLISIEAKTAEGKNFVTAPKPFNIRENAHGTQIIVDKIAEIKKEHEAEIANLEGEILVLEGEIAELKSQSSFPKRSSMAFWYMDGTKQSTDIGWDEEDNEVEEVVGIREEVAFPEPTGVITSFSDMFSYYFFDNWNDGIDKVGGLWARRITGVLDAASVTSLNNLFFDCRHTEHIGEIKNTGGVTDFSYMFGNCSALTSVPALDTRNGTNFGNMFYNCSALTSVPALDVSSATNMRSMFSGCPNLTEVPALDTKKVKTFNTVFYGCVLLETIHLLDFRSVTTATTPFGNCRALKNLTIKNIKVALQVGSASQYGHQLTVDSLVGLCYELIDTGSTKYLTVGSTNLAKLSSVYVKSIAVTAEMRAEDEFIDLKMPFVVCDSTDTGATLITQYVKTKNWSLK